MSSRLSYRVFKEELLNLYIDGYISKEQYNLLNDAEENYNKKILESINTEKETEVSGKMTSQKLIQKAKFDKQSIPKIKQQQTPQDIKDRNNSYILILGVVLILISGLFLATSSWALMNDLTKTMALALVSGIFFGTSIIAQYKLKIEKTAFAFWVLGSLLVPISIFSIGFFKLFGPWFSMFGDGKYLFGFIGSMICMPIYILSIIKYKHRLFLWFAFVNLSSMVSFLLGALELKLDVFYLEIVIYNSILILGYSRFKEKNLVKKYLKDFNALIQTNIILSTLFTIVFFESNIFNGINILLMAMVYMGILFTEGRKEYSFVFSILLMYGFFQIVENSSLKNVDIVLFSCLGLIFIGISKYIFKEGILNKLFNFINGGVTIIVVLFILIKNSLFTHSSPEVLVISFLLLALNYLYLANTLENKLFSSLAPVFLGAALLEFYEVIKSRLPENSYSVYLLIVSMSMFIILYYKNNFKYLIKIKNSSAAVAIVLAKVSILSSIKYENFILASVGLFYLALLIYLVCITINNKIIKKIISWFVPIFIFVGVLFLYGEYGDNFSKTFYGFSNHIVCSVALIYGIGILCRKYSKEFESRFFVVAHVILPFSILFNTLEFLNDMKKFPIVFIFSTIILVQSIIHSLKPGRIRFYLYELLTTVPITISCISAYYDLGEYFISYILYLSSILIFILWIILKEPLKKYVEPYFSVIALGATIPILNMYNFSITDYIYILIAIASVCYTFNYRKINNLAMIPLIFIFIANGFLYSSINGKKDKYYFIVIALVILLNIAGKFLVKKLFDILKTEHNSIKNKFAEIIEIDWYSIFGFMLLLSLLDFSDDKYRLVFGLITRILIVISLYLQIGRVSEGILKKVIKTLTLSSILIPYYYLLNNIESNYSILSTEIYILPLIFITRVASRKIWYQYFAKMKIIEAVVVAFVVLILSTDILFRNSVGEAIVYGTVALISVILGLQLKLKTYFFTGIITLIFNVIFQMKDFFGKLPWWGYLLVAGLVLIITASINEMKKNKGEKLLKISKEDFINKFKGWK